MFRRRAEGNSGGLRQMRSTRRQRARRTFRSRLCWLTLGMAGMIQLAWASRANAQRTGEPVKQERLLLGDLYAQVEQLNPRAAAARALTVAAEARVAGARR